MLVVMRILMLLNLCVFMAYAWGEQDSGSVAGMIRWGVPTIVLAVFVEGIDTRQELARKQCKSP